MRMVKLENLNFPYEFFEDEEREGFLITTMVKRYWAVQLRILSLIAGICDKYDIKWFADCGTLLGAVRHEGFIPWDDDLDICMLRSDWIKFFEVAKKELPEEYVIMTLEEQPQYREVIGRVSNSHAIDYSVGHLKEYCGCPYTVGVDIFPLDNLYDDVEKEKDRMERARRAIDIYLDNGSRQSILKVEKIYRECPDDEASKVTLMPIHISHNDHIYPKELFDSWVELPFENTYIRVPARYEEVLAIEYGDYMRVVKAGGVHDYPAYIGQEEILREKMGHNPFRYTFDSRELLNAVTRYVHKMTNPMEKKDCEKILLLPVRAKWWSSMEGLWLEMKDNPSNEVHVAPLPFYYRDFDTVLMEMNYEGEDFPDYVQVENIDNIDIEGQMFDKIVIQVPYDGLSMSLSVPEFYYSRNLLQFAQELIYVPFFDADDSEHDGDKVSVALSVMVEQPAVINADRVILKTQRMKDFYMRKLIEMSGEETRNYWDQKLTVKEFETPDVTSKTTADEIRWTDLFGKRSDKKIVVYYITISSLLKGGIKAIDKIRNSLRIFEDNSDKVAVVLLPQDLIDKKLAEFDAGLWQEYQGIIEDINAGKYINCVLDKEGMSLDFLHKWNGLYGDTGAIPRKCVEAKVPVMIQNLEV